MYMPNRLTTISSPAPTLWALDPSKSRVERIDLALRERLGKSIRYISEVAVERDSVALSGIEELEGHLAAGSVSPWVYCLYSKLVAELSKRAGADVVTSIFADVVRAASLPAKPGIMAFRDTSLPESWWDHYQILLDTDRQRPFRPQAPDGGMFANCQRDVCAALALLKEGDAPFFDELSNLLRMVVLAAPSGATGGFNGASTFFVWGGALFNAVLTRSPITMLDVLVHESSHVLLFGLSADGPLTGNSGDERYASPVRSDKRPIDGIFHACFVTTRVHLAMGRLLDSRSLSVKDAHEAEQRRQYNGDAARESLDLIAQHAVLTEHGERIFGELRNYWGSIGGTEIPDVTKKVMNDRAREVLVTAVQAGKFGFPPAEEIAKAIEEGSRELTIDQLEFDSLAWMEFCISVELQSGRELTPADVEGMQFVFQIEEWLCARL
jgi:hypothetical protein